MTPLIRLDNITVSRDGTAVLRGATLQLMPGERLAIVGPNGAGKTTLLRAIVGLETAEAGTVELFGTPCVSESQFRVQRPRIGYLFQDSDDQLFCPSVIEDVMFGPLNIGCTETEARDRAEAALASLGIAALGERISHRLSGGEKRLVCLAGLFAMQPDVLLFDEPTNGVDTDNGAHLRAALESFTGALVLVSHDAGFVAGLAERAMILSDGAIDQGRDPFASAYPHPSACACAHAGTRASGGRRAARTRALQCFTGNTEEPQVLVLSHFRTVNRYPLHLEML